ncbi:hypothetical protein ADK53_26995 [Streptomyces sp. WM6373]|uniref:hypothetical protein n=1 Tax=Streptomyces TaxID=1883 RepID=UPI0006AE7795|nr:MULTISPECIES: hypothetical protein [unclassified Streptomyces]KOU30968.1 hypothetical protein ADK53_26995 [Streptomyces sp. WM6373]KOU61916.1 hypothetical protein ADK96_27555 [Streptomyces sp. IGB124]KOU72083.1 hypothetical protein ADK61_28000 [Streptomyces sp. XY66]KOU84240.1 hypothetical protein ADK93_25620 [Streptomyces sp. XY58]KOV04145.1 hypothetical protein ADK89_24435 [Streptomyces sp. XY37]
MTGHGQSHGRRRTTPSQAPGESGDREARREAEEAVRRGSDGGAEGEAGDHAAKRQRPGTGREEQVRPHPPRGERAEPEHDDR